MFEAGDPRLYGGATAGDLDKVTEVFSAGEDVLEWVAAVQDKKKGTGWSCSMGLTLDDALGVYCLP